MRGSVTMRCKDNLDFLECLSGMYEKLECFVMGRVGSV